MATVYNPILDEEKNEQSQINQPEDGVQSGAPAPASSGSSSTIPASAGSSGAAAPNKPSKSGQFTNIQNYIQGNLQGAQKLGQEVANKVDNKVQTGLSGLETSKQAAVGEAQATADRLKAQQNASQQAIQSLTTGQQATDLTGLESKAAEGLSDQYKTDLQNTQFKDLANLQNKGMELAELGDQTRTSAGRQAILQRNFSRPDYTTGQSAFDSLLLGGSKEAQQGLSKARQAVGQYNPNLQAAADQYNAVKNAATADLDTGNAALKASVAQAINRDATATPEQSLYAQLQARANETNAANKANAASMNGSERIKALRAAGYDVNEKSDQVTIPGSNVSISVRELLANPTLFQEIAKNADIGGVDPATLARLNVLNRLGGVNEVAAGSAGGIERGLSAAGKAGIANAKAELASRGLDNLQKLNITGGSADNKAIQRLAQGQLYSNQYGSGYAKDMLSNLGTLKPKQMAEILTKAGIPADDKNAPALLNDMINNITQGPGRDGPYKAMEHLANDTKIIGAIAKQQQDYTAKQATIQSVLDKYLRGIK